MILKIIKGDSYGRACQFVTGNAREPINLTNVDITAVVKSDKFKFEQELSITRLDQTVTENVGKFLIDPVSTADWPVTEVVVKITRTVNGFSTSDKIFYNVEPD